MFEGILGATIGFSLGVLFFAFIIFPGTQKITCENFSKNPQPGLFDTFHGKVCSDSFGVNNIAKNFKQCLQKEDEGDCITEQYGYFRSSGASKEDAGKALELVLKSVNNK